MPTSRYLRQPTAAPQGRSLSQQPVFDLRGLNSTDPYDTLKDSASPYLRNARMYDSEDKRQTAISTRKGVDFYSVPIGETEEETQESTAGASDVTFSTVNWIAQQFEATATGRLTKVEVNIRDAGTGLGHVIVAIYSDSSGEPGTLLATSSILSSELGASYAYETARFVEAPTVTNTEDYWIVLYIQEGGSNTYEWSTTTNTSLGATSNTSGNTWTTAQDSRNFKTHISTDGGVLGFARYTPSSGNNETIFAHGTNLYKVNDSTGVTTSIKSGLDASATKYRFTQANDKLYIANGYDSLMEWNGTAISDNALTTVPANVISHKNRIFIQKASDLTRIEFSNIADDTTWESTSFIYVPTPKSNDPIAAIHSFQDTLVFYTRNNKYVLYGSDLGDFTLKQALGKEGARSQEATASDENVIFSVSDDGIYAWNGSKDKKISLPIEADLDDIADIDDVTTYIYENRFYISFATTGGTDYDAKFVYDADYGEWFYDTGSDSSHGLSWRSEDGQLVQASDKVGALYYGDRQFSDMGKPINFEYWTKYWNFGYSDNKKQVRRLYLHLRSQAQPFSMNVYIDKDFANSPVEKTVDLQGVGDTWGGTTWGGGTWGKTEYIHSKINIPGQGVYFQVRLSKTGVDTPVELIGYNQHYRLRRAR